MAFSEFDRHSKTPAVKQEKQSSGNGIANTVQRISTPCLRHLLFKLKLNPTPCRWKGQCRFEHLDPKSIDPASQLGGHVIDEVVKEYPTFKVVLAAAQNKK